jgi:hypothetical protein
MAQLTRLSARRDPVYQPIDSEGWFIDPDRPRDLFLRNCVESQGMPFHVCKIGNRCFELFKIDRAVISQNLEFLGDRYFALSKIRFLAMEARSHLYYFGPAPFAFLSNLSVFCMLVLFSGPFHVEMLILIPNMRMFSHLMERWERQQSVLICFQTPPR